MDRAPDHRQRVAGVLLGTAVGDALGLPAEGLSRQRIARRWGGEWRHRFLFGRGMLSDDTEHTLFVAQAILDHPRDVEGFRRSLAWKLRWWLVGLPAGVGMSTLRASFKLWLGWPAHRSGVFSAGNGPAMRAGIIGAAFPEDPERRESYVRASTLITHTDPRALTGSLAVAEFVAAALRGPVDPGRMLSDLRGLADAADTEWPDLLDRIETSLDRGISVVAFADDLGLEKGVSGYVYHTVPVALFAAMRLPTYEQALTAVLDLGGDTDTVGAILGALSGAQYGRAEIPDCWLSGIAEWPRTITLLDHVAERLTRQAGSEQPLGRVRYFWPALLPRNLLFLGIVLMHGFFRLVPTPRANRSGPVA